jgi:hypothetical protein
MLTAGKITLRASLAYGDCNPAGKTIYMGGFSSSDYPVSGPSSTSCGQLIDFTTNALPGATSYNWFWPSDWNYISGQGTRYLTLQTSSYGATSGYVGVRVANSCDAGGSPATKYVQVSCNGFYSYSVSPNPASTSVTITGTDKTKTSPITSVKIYDSQGNLKRQQAYNKVTKAVLDISSLPVGVYIIEIANGSYQERQQLTIAK